MTCLGILSDLKNSCFSVLFLRIALMHKHHNPGVFAFTNKHHFYVWHIELNEKVPLVTGETLKHKHIQVGFVNEASAVHLPLMNLLSKSLRSFPPSGMIQS